PTAPRPASTPPPPGASRTAQGVHLRAEGPAGMARDVTFLGTASQVPTRTRNQTALFLAWDGLGILFDAGEGTQRQMTHAGVRAAQLTHIVLTHFHGDHCLGLAGVLQRLSLDRVPHPVEVVYPAGGQAYFERLRHASAYHEAATLVPRPVAVP